MRPRRRARGFVIFATVFWAGVVTLGALATFALPDYKGRGCLARLFFGLGGLVGLFGGASVFLVFTSKLMWPLPESALLPVMGLGGILGATSAASLTARFEGRAQQQVPNRCG